MFLLMTSILPTLLVQPVGAAADSEGYEFAVILDGDRRVDSTPECLAFWLSRRRATGSSRLERGARSPET